MAIYTLELAVLFAAKRWQVLREGAILFDIFTVLCGFAATTVRAMNLPETRKRFISNIPYVLFTVYSCETGIPLGSRYT